MSDVWCLVYYCDCDFVAMDVIVTAIHRSPLILPSNCLPVDSPTFHSSIHSYVHPSLPEPMYPPALPSIQPTHLSPRPVPFLVFLCLASSISSFSLWKCIGAHRATAARIDHVAPGRDRNEKRCPGTESIGSSHLERHPIIGL